VVASQSARFLIGLRNIHRVETGWRVRQPAGAEKPFLTTFHRLKRLREVDRCSAVVVFRDETRGA
jgi:hypothetical protein